VLESSEETDGASRRLPLGNLFNRLLGCALVLPLLGPVSHLLSQLEVTPARLVADFHTFFNVVMALLFLPFLGGYARLLSRWLPGASQVSPGQPVYLDSKAQETPALALAAAAREALRMADALELMLQSGIKALRQVDRKQMSNTRALDATLNDLDHAIKNYLVALDQEHLDRDEQVRVLQIITFVSNLENAGDVLDKEVMKPLARQTKQGMELSPAGRRELLALLERLVENTRLAAAVFVSGNLASARQLVAEKQHFRDLEMKLTEAHFGRLREGRIDSHQTSRLHLQLVNELKRINNYLVEGAAWPLLENDRGAAFPEGASITHIDSAK
jgi:phosphate:Na+ symporter